MLIDLNNKVALVTGGTQGIGKAIALSLLSSGARVIYTGRSTDGKTINHPNAQYEAVDFSNDQSVASFLKTLDNYSIDILINNAGINKIAAFGDINPEDWLKIQKVNVEGPFRLCHHLAPKMAQKNFGRIINMGSIFSHVSKEKRGSYSTSKFALLGMSKALALDYAASNVLVNVVSPGFIDTELTRNVLSKEELQTLISQVPQKRLGKPEEIANLVVFLCSEQNSFINAQNILIDGGFTSV
jgi:NAD(P)-dependent dehydrogenase (short-subunit alcohol dehydrogenase family)